MNDEILEALGKAKVAFWTCLVRHHGERRGPQGQIIQTVKWIDGVAHCTAPGCELTSAETSHYRDIVVEVYGERFFQAGWEAAMRFALYPRSQDERDYDDGDIAQAYAAHTSRDA